MTLNKEKTNSLGTDYSSLVEICFAFINKVDVYVGNIPDKKLNKAMKLWAKTLSPEEKNLVLIDDTFFGSVKNGILLTSIACYHHSEQGTGVFQYSEIESFTRSKDFPKNGINVITKDGEVHKLYLIAHNKILPSIESLFSGIRETTSPSVPISKEQTKTSEQEQSKDEVKKSSNEYDPVQGVIGILLGIAFIGFSVWLWWFRPASWGIPGILVWIPAAFFGIPIFKGGWNRLTGSPVNEDEEVEALKKKYNI